MTSLSGKALPAQCTREKVVVPPLSHIKRPAFTAYEYVCRRRNEDDQGIHRLSSSLWFPKSTVRIGFRVVP